MKIENEDIKIWSMNEGRISSLKVKNQIINVRPDASNVNILSLARQFFKTFEVVTVVKEITQLPNMSAETYSILKGKILGKLYGISIYDKVVLELREKFKSESFTILEAGKFLKDKYNLSENNCQKKAQAYTKYLKDNNKLSIVGKVGKQKVFKFNTIKPVLDKEFLKRTTEEERTTRQGA